MSRPTITAMTPSSASAKLADLHGPQPGAPSRGSLVLRSALLTAAGMPHGFAMRCNGVSRAYLADRQQTVGELNLGFTASDERAHVLENRRSLLDEVFGSPRPLITLRQVHSATSLHVSATDAGEEAVLEGDGLLTQAPGVAIGILTADCVPVLLLDPRRRMVAAFHAGWRGTVARILEDGVRQMRDCGSRAEDLVAAVGPSIGACCYTVGEEVEEVVRSRFSYADSLFETADVPGPGQTLRFNLQEANRRQLLTAGVALTAIDVLKHCTSCRNDRYFSYRAEKGFTGRLLSVIGLPG